jgi:hypothetical protein
MNEGLEGLRKESIQWVEANQSKRFSGVTKLLTDLYPDNAHFIYELLQNAEDAREKSKRGSCGASVVRFTLSDDALEFEHDGKGLFTLSDVESITGIGDSTKRDDPTSIGKFGVGFKAVFAYTDTPEIHSRDYSFCIRDLVVPEAINPKPIDQQQTRFRFPFNNSKKPATKAVEEISNGLKTLGDNTLLFLQCIRKIEFLLPDGSLGTQERIEHGDGHLEIRSSSAEGEATSHWLRFENDVQVSNSDVGTKDCRIAIAYRLEADDSKTNRNGWNIVPLDHGQVSIYFPAEKETSNLRFHLHAPFASTVARDSVRDCTANNELRDHLAALVVGSLVTLRDRGFLNVGFLAVLPNNRDNLSEFYQPIRKAIVEAFQTEALTPTRSGSHRCAKELYRGPAAIQEVIGDEDLSLLADEEAPLWARNPRQENQREANFLGDLAIAEWGWEKLASAIGNRQQYVWHPGLASEIASYQKRIENWIHRKDDAWLIKFYALLGEAHDTHHKITNPGIIQIVRVEGDSGHQHVKASEAYFSPSDEAIPSRPDIRFVKASVYKSGRSDSNRRLAESFLKYAGVRPYDAKALIEKILDDYKRSLLPKTRKMHITHIKQFVSYWKENTRCIDMFKHVARSGRGYLDSFHGLDKWISARFYAAAGSDMDWKYTASGDRRSSELCGLLVL